MLHSYLVPLPSELSQFRVRHTARSRWPPLAPGYSIDRRATQVTYSWYENADARLVFLPTGVTIMLSRARVEGARSAARYGGNDPCR